MQLTARAWTAAAAALALLLALAAWLLLVGPARADAAALRTEAADTVARNEQLAQRTEVLRQQFANLPDEEAELAALTRALPADVELPTLIRTIDGFADDTGVTVMSIAPGATASVVDPAAAVPAPATTDGTATTDGAATTTTDGAATTTTDGATVDGGAATMATPVTTTVIGDFFDAQAFLRRLQAEMPRAYLVRTLSVTAEEEQDAAAGRPATAPGDVTMTITADVFSRPTTAQDGAGAPAAAPAQPVPPSAAPSPSPSSPPSSAPSDDGSTPPGPSSGATVTQDPAAVT